MNKLFTVLDGIISDKENRKTTLSNPESVQNYAEFGCGIEITEQESARIIATGEKWLDDIENGNGEWIRMRHEAIDALAE